MEIHRDLGIVYNVKRRISSLVSPLEETPANDVDIAIAVTCPASCPLSFDYLAHMMEITKPGKMQLISWKGHLWM